MSAKATAAAPLDREASLIEGISRIHGRLNQSLRSLQLDDRLARVAGTELPDAAARLDYVVKLTEEAAHKTLDLVDEAREVTSSMLRTPQATVQKAQTEKLSELLSEVALAQSYQDLTGQTIRRVVDMVRNTEDALHTLLEAAGVKAEEIELEWDGEANGPAVTQSDAGVSQDDADDLLSGLGL